MYSHSSEEKFSFPQKSFTERNESQGYQEKIRSFLCLKFYTSEDVDKNLKNEEVHFRQKRISML